MFCLIAALSDAIWRRRQGRSRPPFHLPPRDRGTGPSLQLFKPGASQARAHTARSEESCPDDHLLLWSLRARAVLYDTYSVKVCGTLEFFYSILDVLEDAYAARCL